MEEQEKIKKYFKSKKIFFAAWSCESKFFNMMANWYEPLKKIFGRVIVFDPQKQMYQLGKKARDKKFLEILKKEKPDYLFRLYHPDEFNVEILFEIKKISPKTKTICYFSDDETHFDYLSKYMVPLFCDFALTAQKSVLKDYKKEGIKNAFFIYGINPELFRPKNLEKKYDVSFIGNPKANRYELIKFLKKQGVKIMIFGSGWSRYGDLKEIYGGQPDNEEMVDIINRTKINLCFTRNIDGKGQIKGRIFEVGACKSFMLAEGVEKVSQLFNKDGLVTFDGKEDLLNKIKYYLKHEKERTKIEKKTYDKVIKDYNADVEFKNLFKIVYDQRNIPPKKLPKIDKKAFTFREDGFKKGLNKVKKKIENYDYIAFKKGGTRVSKYRDYLQSYCLIKSNKPISCCDYYISSTKIGDYLLFNPYEFKNLNKKEKISSLNINQMMVKKDFFIKNFEKFKRFFNGGEIDILTDENIAFISFHLVSIEDIKVNKGLIRKILEIRIEDKFSSLIYQKKIFSDNYIYNFLIESLFFVKFFLMKYLINNYIKTNFLKTFSAIKRLSNKSLYKNL